MMPDHPSHHSPRHSKDTQGQPATILSNPAFPRQNIKEKAMLSIIHTLTKSAYKTFQANPGVTTLPTPKNIGRHQSKSPPTESPTNKSPVHTIVICQALGQLEKEPVHTDSPQRTPCDHPKAEPECPTPISKVI